MNKIFITFLISINLSFAGLINSIAITVNEEPITFYDIQKLMEEQNIDKNQAVSILIDKQLYEQIVKKYSISADILDIEEYISKLAAQNSMDTFTFKSLITQKYPSYEVFEEEAKKVIIRQKLVKKVIRGNLKVATEEDMKIFYNNNKDKFSSAKEFEVIQYTSKDRRALGQAITNPMMVINKVQKNSVKLEASKIPSQLQFLLNSLKENNFSPILKAQDGFLSFLLIKKSGTDTIDFEVIKNKIFNDIMTDREQKFLKDFFEKEKLTADIKIVK